MPAEVAQSAPRTAAPAASFTLGVFATTMSAWSKDGGKLLYPHPIRRCPPAPSSAPPEPLKGITRSDPSYSDEDCTTGMCIPARVWQQAPQLQTAPWTPYPHQGPAAPEVDLDLPRDRFELPLPFFFRMPLCNSLQKWYRYVMRADGTIDDKDYYHIHTIAPAYFTTPRQKVSTCLRAHPEGGKFLPTWPTGNGWTYGGMTSTRINLGPEFESQ